MNKNDGDYKPERILPLIAVLLILEAIGLYLLFRGGCIPM
jgi:hypothetical protein